MSRLLMLSSGPKHLVKEIHMLKVRVWVAITIALVVSAEVGIALAVIAKIFAR